MNLALSQLPLEIALKAVDLELLEAVTSALA